MLSTLTVSNFSPPVLCWAHSRQGLAQNLLLSPGIQLVNTMPLCKLENGTRLHGYMINSCGLHMHGSEAGRASGPLTHLNRHHCARHASPSTVLLLWLPVVNLLISSQPWCYLHCQQRRPGWIPTYSLKHLHYSTFFCFFFFFFFFTLFLLSGSSPTHPILLRYNWNKTLYKFTLYHVMISYTYILWSDYNNN